MSLVKDEDTFLTLMFFSWNISFHACVFLCKTSLTLPIFRTGTEANNSANYARSTLAVREMPILQVPTYLLLHVNSQLLNAKPQPICESLFRLIYSHFRLDLPFFLLYLRDTYLKYLIFQSSNSVYLFERKWVNKINVLTVLNFTNTFATTLFTLDRNPRPPMPLCIQWLFRKE